MDSFSCHSEGSGSQQYARRFITGTSKSISVAQYYRLEVVLPQIDAGEVMLSENVLVL